MDLQLSVSVFGHNALNPLVGIQKITDRGIMVQSIDDIGHIFTHITVDIPFPLQKLRSLVDQVGSQNSGDQTALIGPVKLFKSAREQPKGGEYKYLTGFALF